MFLKRGIVSIQRRVVKKKMRGIVAMEINVMIGLMGRIMAIMMVVVKTALRIVPSHVLRNMSTN